MKVKKFISLTKIQVKDFFSKYKSGLNIKNKGLRVLAMVGLGLWLWSLYIRLVNNMIGAFNSIGHPELVVNLGYLGSVIFMFITSIPFVLAVFFYARDTQFVISLPIRENSIIYAKLASIYIYLSAISFLVLAPVIGLYAGRIELNILGLVFGFLGIFLVPLLPLLISTLLVLPLSKYVGGKKRRNLLNVVGGILLMVVIIGIQQLLFKFEGPQGEIEQFLANADLLEMMGSRFPPSIWFTKMMMGSIGNLLLFLGLNLVLLMLLNWLGGRLYRKALFAYNQSSDTGRGKIYYRQRNISLQMIKRHFLIITNEPTFLLNALGSMFFPIVMFAVMYFAGDISLSIFNAPFIRPYLSLIFGAIITAPVLVSNISVTPITREGKKFWQTKVFPISTWENLRYRVLTTVILNLIGAVVLGLILNYVIALNLKVVILGGLLHLTVSFFFSTVDLMINIKRPLLDWTNPSAAVKNNINSLFSLIPRAIAGILIYILIKLSGVKGDILVLALIAIFGLGYLVVRSILKNRYVEEFDKITV